MLVLGLEVSDWRRLAWPDEEASVEGAEEAVDLVALAALVVLAGGAEEDDFLGGI
jgi:hypothetical protein